LSGAFVFLSLYLDLNREFWFPTRYSLLPTPWHLVEVGFAGGFEDNFERSVLTLRQSRALDLLLVVVGRGVQDLHRAVALNLDAVVHCGSSGKAICAEAGAWVVNFKQTDGGAGVIFHGYFDVGRMAACGSHEHGHEHWGGASHRESKV